MQSVRRLWHKARYAVAVSMFRPDRRILDGYFGAVSDAYRMAINGEGRMEALARAIDASVGPCRSILDVGCYEGYCLRYIADHLAAESVIGLDISEAVLARARARCAGISGAFRQYDLTRLYDGTDTALPPEVVPCDVVLVCDVLYYVGPRCTRLWSRSTRQMAAKQALVRQLQRYARKALILEHFSSFREPIGQIAESCGGRMLDAEWGIYRLPGAAD